MAKTLRCRDVGMDCDYEAHGTSEQDVLQQAAAHAKADHGMDQIPAEVLAKAKSVIRDE